MKPFEIFRSGRHTARSGVTLTFADTDLAAVASGYDVDVHHAPIVVGHPEHDKPAYGWVDGLALNGDRLVATPGSVDAAFAELVREKKFRKVSAAFYQPDSPNNPKPGSYYLRHVGFLGAAAPAVKGLKPAEFAADDTLVVEFDDIEFAADWRVSWAIGSAARLFRGVRDFLIETKDLETANRVLPEWEVEQLTTTAADIRAEERVEADTRFSEPLNELKDKIMNMPAAGKTAEQIVAELTDRETKIAQREAEFAERQKKDRATADADFVDGVVKAGRLPVGLQAQATALFADLGDGELAFADGDETKKTTPRAAFRDLLEKLPIPVSTGELAKGEGPDFSDPVAVAVAIETEIKAAAGKGETISPADAIARLNKRSK